MSLPRFRCFGVDRPRRAAPPRVCRPRHDAVLSISRSSLALAPDGYVFALPAERTSTSSLIARMPPARAGNADTRDNLVFDRVDSALFGNETSRRPRTARVRLPMATSAVRTSDRGGSFSRRRAVRETWHHHRRCVLTHLPPSVVLELDPAGSCKPLESEPKKELGEICLRRPPLSDRQSSRLSLTAPISHHQQHRAAVDVSGAAQCAADQQQSAAGRPPRLASTSAAFAAPSSIGGAALW